MTTTDTPRADGSPHPEGSRPAPDSARTALHLIDGQQVEAGELSDVTDPATGEVVGRVWRVSGEEATTLARRAADAAAAAQSSWAQTSPRTRARILHDAVDLLAERADEIALTLALEAGKRLPEARGEVAGSAEYLTWFAEEVRRPRGEFFTSEDAARRQLSIHRPLGVVATLTPWNFPVSIQARKVAPALAAGNTVVARVSEKAPLAVTRWLSTLHEAGLPEGVLNIVHGAAGTITETWTGHPAVRGISFTGSTGVGSQVLAQSARRIVRPMMELGGDAAFIVAEDADMEVALLQAELGKLRNTGQSCIGINRFLVHRSRSEEFSQRLAARFDELTIGPGTADPLPDLGPVIDESRVREVTALVDDALTRGARRLTAERELPETGTWLAPTLLADVPLDARIAREEVFGPAAAIFVFDTDEEAAEIANSTEMGLASYVITQDAGRAFRYAEQLDSGIVGINDALPTVAFTPMGGTKQSGLGREGGTDGLREFQETTYVAWRP